MNTRLQEIIKYKTRGRQKDFAELMGWSPQYVQKLVKGANFGFTPVLAIVEKLPEINARWFLTGEGQMLSDSRMTDIRREFHGYVESVLGLERYMPVMTPEELNKFERVILGKEKAVFSPDTLTTWQRRLAERDYMIKQKFAAAKGAEQNT